MKVYLIRQVTESGRNARAFQGYRIQTSAKGPAKMTPIFAYPNETRSGSSGYGFVGKATANANLKKIQKARKFKSDLRIVSL